jgi:hypothetical protein
MKTCFMPDRLAGKARLRLDFPGVTNRSFTASPGMGGKLTRAKAGFYFCALK